MSELKAGALLYGGKYRIEKSLGQGGFGITYLAEQTNLGRKVCIKEFFIKEYGERTASPQIDSEETVITGGVPSSRPKDVDATVLTGVSAVTSAAAEIMGKYREKFVKEARTIARLDHPGIVRIHDVFEENGTAYYVMDFIEGENLNDMVKREGPLPEGRALGYIRQVADALSYVHDHKIMHLDVKPANVLVRKSDDKAILIDFGTAKQYDSEGTQTSTTPVGLSVGYAPIEMTKPGGVQTFSPETDVYSLGATLYYLVTGQNPPDASERMEMIMEGEKFKLPGNVSSATADVIEQSMQARKKRIPNVNGFLALLNSDSEKKRLEVEEKATKEAEAKHQEELRIEREKAEAEKKRIAEEKSEKAEEKGRNRIIQEEAAALDNPKEKGLLRTYAIVGAIILTIIYVLNFLFRVPAVVDISCCLQYLVFIGLFYLVMHTSDNRMIRSASLLIMGGYLLFIIGSFPCFFYHPGIYSYCMLLGDLLVIVGLVWVSSQCSKGSFRQILFLCFASLYLISFIIRCIRLRGIVLAYFDAVLFPSMFGCDRSLRYLMAALFPILFMFLFSISQKDKTV